MKEKQDKSTVTIRIRPENQKSFWKAVLKKKKDEQRPSVSNTLEVSLMDYFKIGQ